MDNQITFNELPALADTLLSQGRYNDVLKISSAFLEKGVANLVVIQRAMFAAIEKGDTENTLQLLEQIKARLPDNAVAWKLVANVANSMHLWYQVLDAIARAEACGEDPRGLVLHKASALEHLLRPEEALRLLEGFESSDAMEQLSCRYVRATSLLQLRRYQEIVDELEPVIASAPVHVYAMACWKVYGKALDKLGRIDDAFNAFASGNAMSRNLYAKPLESNVLGMRMRAMAAVYSSDWVASLPPVKPVQFAPVFLVGFPRSGTTLLEQILDSHPDIQALEETLTVEQIWGALAPMLTPSAVSPGDGAAPDTPDAQTINRLRRINSLADEQLDQLRDAYESAVARHLALQPGKVFIDKLPLNIVSIGLLVRLYPDAKFIVALRHPCDCIMSCFMQNFELNDGMQHMRSLETAADLYSGLMSLLWQYQSVLGLDRQMHYIRYEDMVEDMQGEVERLLSFLGLPWNDALFDFHTHAATRGTLNTPSREGVGSRIYKDSVGRWRRYQQYFEPLYEKLSPACERYGYSLEGEDK